MHKRFYSVFLLLLLFCLAGCSEEKTQEDLNHEITYQAESLPGLSALTKTGKVISVNNTPNYTAISYNYITVLKRDVRLPRGYTYHYVSDNVAYNTPIQIYKDDQESQDSQANEGIIYLYPNRVSTVVDSRDQALILASVLISQYKPDTVQIEQQIPVEINGFYYCDITFADDTKMSFAAQGNDLYIILSNKDNKDANEILSYIMNPPSTPLQSDTYLPMEYVQVDGGFYYSASAILSGDVTIFPLTDADTIVQVFNAQSDLVYELILSKTNMYLPITKTLHLDESDFLYCGASCGISRSDQ